MSQALWWVLSVNGQIQILKQPRGQHYYYLHFLDKESVKQLSNLPKATQLQ